VDVHDQPYKLLTGWHRNWILMRIKKEHHPVRPERVTRGSARRPLTHSVISPSESRLRMGSRAGFVKPVSEFPIADLYVCWNKDAIYLGLYAPKTLPKLITTEIK